MLGEYEVKMRRPEADRFELVDLADGGEGSIKSTDAYREAKQRRLEQLGE